MKSKNPDFSNEKNSDKKLIAGLDEAGRGPLCGPVVAAAVVFDDFDLKIPVLITDSKKMNEKSRSLAAAWIKENTKWAIGIATVNEIDEINILWASMLAMERAVQNLPKLPQLCLIDGNRVPKNLNTESVAIVKGDSKSISIAAASILAKQARDDIMKELANDFPEYGWDKNAGYGTKQHLCAIEKFGVNQHHRKTFGPIKQRMEKCS